MDQQLMLGILLIIVGAAFALIAVAVVLNRRTDEQEDPGQSEQADADAEVDATAPQASEIAVEEHEPAAMEQSEAAMQPEAIDSDVESDTLAETMMEADEPDSSAARDAPVSEAEGPQAVSREPTPVISVLREPDSGSLILRAGEQEFRSARQMRSETQRQAIVAVLEELAEWFADVDRSAALEWGAEQSGSGMVQAIDAILQRSLESANISERGVKLISDASGSVKVLIGVKSYELDQVPNKQIQELIRQAVAEWEATQ